MTRSPVAAAEVAARGKVDVERDRGETVVAEGPLRESSSDWR
jgi:hypothetical protein